MGIGGKAGCLLVSPAAAFRSAKSRRSGPFLAAAAGSLLMQCSWWSEVAAANKVVHKEIEIHRAGKRSERRTEEATVPANSTNS
jgi:hypothetical protein